MARKSGSTIQEELYAPPDDAAREELEDARLLDLDAEKESPFLRAQKRVSARRSPLPKKTAARLLWALLVIVIAGLAAVAASSFYHYGERSWRFRLNSSDDIEMVGLGNVTRTQVMEVMGADIGRNVFYIPLDQRQKQLERIPWVESASVMRFAPDRIRIQIHERTPIAFARVGSRIMLVDVNGALMDLPSRHKYSFPVVVGLNPSDPLSTRAAGMKIYNELIRQLDSAGHYSQDLSEVDVSDPEDVKVLTNDPDGEVLVHLGSSNYFDRFKIYVAYLRQWRQQFPKLESVDLRYERQIVVNPDLRAQAPMPHISPAAAKAAIAAGVKPATLVAHEAVPAKPSHPAVAAKKPIDRPAPKPAKTAAHWQKHAPPKHVAAKKAAPVAHKVQKPAAAAKQALRKPAVHNASVVVRTQPTSAAQKPSPAIRKGQDSR